MLWKLAIEISIFSRTRTITTRCHIFFTGADEKYATPRYSQALKLILIFLKKKKNQVRQKC